MKTVAVVGSGISGLAAAYFLSRRHEVHLFEKDRRLGGHTNTVVVEGPDGRVPLDTGFLVHNDRTYPNLVRLFRDLGVATRDSDMSFAVACRRTGLEYSSRGAAGFFAQQGNLVRPSHYRLLAEIVRFNRAASALLRGDNTGTATLGDFLAVHRFSADFTRNYLFPMAAAIWSASLASIRAFPLMTFVRFFDNHGLLGLTTQPMWKVVAGGSHTYIPKLLAPLGDRVVTDAAITAITRHEDGVTLAFAERPSRRFDEVVLACHGDEVLPLLADASDREREVFTQFTTTPNVAILHTDASVLPARLRARAAWNYLLTGDDGEPPTVTYDLNRLQGLRTRVQYCVTLNPHVAIDERLVLRRFAYTHPLYTTDAVRAQDRWHEVSGARRTHFCGAYWGYGFHEDGLRSALRVAATLGVTW